MNAPIDIRFELLGPPRTKKTHQRIVRFKSGSVLDERGRPKEYIRVLPSKEYMEWAEGCNQQVPAILARYRHLQLLPLDCPVEVTATFYRERNLGDLAGFIQALGDWLQGEKDKKTRMQTWGILKDDRQIQSWDGSRLAKDAQNPRVEVIVRPLGAEQLRIVAPLLDVADKAAPALPRTRRSFEDGDDGW